jgi:hypothetical protein
MSYSDSFPQQRPTLNLDFANSGKLDSRLSYSRSSTGTAFSAEKHLSSLNLLKYSTAFDNAAWGTNNMPAPTTGQTDPSGGTGGCILIANTTNGSHNKFQSQVTSGELSFTVFAKPASGTMRMMLNLYNAANNWEVFLFDLVGGTPVAASGTSSTFSNVSATQTASGNGYYKCTIKATGSITSALVALNPNATTSGLDAYGDISFAGDNTAGITVAFASLSTVGSSDYNATTTQIHREYSSTLKSYSSDQPRFEFATDGQSEGSGTAKGLLIEAQSSNLATYGSDLTNAAWNPLSAFIGGTAVGPDGTLSAVKLVASAGSGFYPRFRRLSLLTDTTQTFSIYVKPLEFQHLAISADGSTSSLVQYNLSGNGAITSQTGATGSVEQCGNGWFRVSFSYTTVPNAHLAITMQSSTTYQTETGNGYDGMLFAMAQLENSSHASSFIGTTSSTVTRAADSCSVATSSFYTGGDVSIVSETIGGSGNFAGCWVIKNSTGSEALQLYKQSAAATEATDFHVYANSGGTNTVNTLITSSASAGKIAVSYGSNDVAFTASGNAVQTDTSSSSIGAVDTLIIGGITTTNQLNGHIKRLSLYSVALSDVELQSLTSNP